MLEGGAARAAPQNLLLFAPAWSSILLRNSAISQRWDCRGCALRVVDQESLNTLCDKLRVARRH
jgi:hypothetical protein